VRDSFNTGPGQDRMPDQFASSLHLSY
jgi:hypothetical protein